MNMKNKKAFTLVELIVVISILAILWTIAFVSLQWYTRDARDSARISDMQNIEKWLELTLIKNGSFPVPDDKIDITASGVVVSYQWYAWNNVLNTIWIHWDWVDPLDETYYTYAVNASLTKYQLLWFLENNNIGYINSMEKSYASLKERFLFSKWNELGIFLDPVTNNPIQNNLSSLDIVFTSVLYKVKINNWNYWETIWTWTTFSQILSYRINEIWSCYSILKNGNSMWDWIYKITHNWKNNIEVYCDMTTNWWGRTRTHQLSYNALPSENTIDWYKWLFTTTKSYSNSGYTLDITNFYFNEFAYLTDNLKSNIEKLSNWNIKTVWNKNEWFSEWIKTYTEWRDCMGVSSCTYPRSNNWYYYRDIHKNIKEILNVWDSHLLETTWYWNMDNERLLSWHNWSNGSWAWTNFPFWKRNLSKKWCYWWKNHCDLSNIGAVKWASLWLR